MTELELLKRATDLLKQIPLPLLRNYDNPTAALAEDIEQFCAGIVREDEGPLCETCRYWHKAVKDSLMGGCKRHAPINDNKYLFPQMGPKGWCGDHEAGATP